MATNWLVDWYFGQVQEERSRLNADPGLPAYPWLPDGSPYTLPGVGRTPLSLVYSARTRRYPVLVNLDELRRNVQLALTGKPDTRTPQQKSRDAWQAFQAAKEIYDRGSSRATIGACTGRYSVAAPGKGTAREATSDPQAGPGDGKVEEAGRPPEGSAPPA